ncbi:toll/interleukin-1 receptor domain-containing protein [Aquabacterium humicola]|uniref:toll/interleukin-1 receptor domain-containing protein n=1 Tax=Aquabacterium humicola TaxID=3237377 RepID=UPI002543D008|nr:TIR domain-containing protein [Rubrivivax pictus]
MRFLRSPEGPAGVRRRVAGWLRRTLHLPYTRWQQLFGFDFFISYSRREATAYAVALEKALAQAGFKCFLDREEFSAGDELRAATEAHLENSSALILVATPLALTSPYVQHEVEYFLSLKRPVIPLSIGEAVENAVPDSLIAKSLRNLIWIPEAADQLPTGPSDSTVKAVVQAVAITRRSARRLRTFATLSVFLFGLAVAAGYFAVAESSARELAERRSRVATSQRLASEARLELQGSAPRSLALAVESVKVTNDAGEPTLGVSEEALREILAATGGVQAATHEGGIEAIAASPDGLHIASGGADRVLRIGDIHNPSSAPQEVRVHGEPITAIAFSKDGKWLASGSEDHTVVLLDRSGEAAGAAPRTLRCHSGGITKLVISDDSRWLASASFNDGTVCVWDLAAPAESSKPVTLSLHKNSRSSSTPTIAFSPDSRWLMTGFRHDPFGRLWRTGKSLESRQSYALPGHAEGVVSAAFTPDSASVLTADIDGSLRQWS